MLAIAALGSRRSLRRWTGHLQDKDYIRNTWLAPRRAFFLSQLQARSLAGEDWIFTLTAFNDAGESPPSVEGAAALP